MSQNSSFCPVPWVSVSTKPNGDLRLCCHANISTSKGMHKTKDGKNFNLVDSKIDSARNSYLAKSVRKSMISGIQHEMCTRCNNEDKQGVRSRRLYENEKWSEKFNLSQAKKITSKDGTISSDQGFFHLDIRLGNLCNLRCRMCGPTDSASWYQEHYLTEGQEFQDSVGVIRLESDKISERIFAVNSPYHWHESSEIWNDFQKYIPTITDYYFAGGEPLLIQRHYELLEKIIDCGQASNVRIEYNTNLTHLPDKVFNLWKYFKQVNVGVSIDGYKHLNEYIRYPSDWNKLVSNILKIDKSDSNIQIWSATTLQIYNCVGILDLINWIFQSDFKKFGQQKHLPFVTCHKLHAPTSFSLQALPQEAKAYVREKYSTFFIKMRQNDNRFNILENNLTAYLNYMDSEDQSVEINEFKRRTKNMDLYRNQDFSLVCPDIAELIKYSKY